MLSRRLSNSPNYDPAGEPHISGVPILWVGVMARFQNSGLAV